MATLMQRATLFAWDECTMAHKKSYEALDRTMRDFTGINQLMGRKLLLLTGDFRQTLPVIPRSTPADEINACIKTSYLWKHVKIIKLTTNMRVYLKRDSTAHQFSQQLLQIGDGKYPIDENTKELSFPSNFCQLEESLQNVIQRVFPNITHNFKNYDWLGERAILAPKNDDVNKINHQILLTLPGEMMKYNSIDTVMDENQSVNYPIEFLNSLEPSGMPPHVLQLKIGAPLMVIRNLDPPRMCNGTRVVIKSLSPNLIETTIMNGKHRGENILIPRIPMISTDLSFEFKRLQFPVRLAFAMTINKSQGQTLKVAGLNLTNSCFSHGQLYVACSRVGTPKNLIVYAPNGKTKNIVYPLALR